IQVRLPLAELAVVLLLVVGEKLALLAAKLDQERRLRLALLTLVPHLRLLLLRTLEGLDPPRLLISHPARMPKRVGIGVGRGQLVCLLLDALRLGGLLLRHADALADRRIPGDVLALSLAELVALCLGRLQPVVPVAERLLWDEALRGATGLRDL